MEVALLIQTMAAGEDSTKVVVTFICITGQELQVVVVEETLMMAEDYLEATVGAVTQDS